MQTTFLMHCGRLARKACGLAILLSGLGSLAWAAAPGSAPEIDPGSIAGALTLLSGGVLLLTDRRRRK